MSALIVSRLLHHLAIAVLFGVAVFPLYAVDLPAPIAYQRLSWLPRVLLTAALLAVVSSISWLIFVAAATRGSLAGAFEWATLSGIASQTNFGRVWTFRLPLAVVLAALLFLKLNRLLIYAVLIGSALLLVSLAGTGRADQDTSNAAAVHVFVDALHLLASAIWIGALVAFVTLLAISRRTQHEADAMLLRQALGRFSEIGSGVVVVLLLSGLANPNVLASFGTQYGQGLLAKLFLFGLMLLLAAANRFWLTPKLETALDSGTGSEGPIRALHASIVAETAIGVLVLAIVAWLGTLPVRN